MTDRTRPGNPPPKVHKAYLDGLRGLAALYVVAHHSYLEVWDHFARHQAPTGLLRPLLAWLLYGRFAVDLFIVLSGYCLMLPVIRDGGTLRGGTLGFYRRRARRILPTFYAAVALCVILDWVLIGGDTPVGWRAILSCLVMTQNVWHAGEVNHAFWSVAVEWWIYFLMPPLVSAWRRFGPGPTAAAVLAAIVPASIVQHRANLDGINVQYVLLFVLGMLAATLAGAEPGRLARIRDRTPWGVASTLLGALMVGVCSWKGIDSMFWRWARYDAVVGLGWACFLVFLAGPRGAWFAGRLSWRPLVSTGVIGYSLYLIHAPLLEILCKYAFAPMGLGDLGTFALLAAVGIPIIVAASSAFAHFFEPASRAVVEIRPPQAVLAVALRPVVAKPGGTENLS